MACRTSIARHKLNADWHSVGKLLDQLAVDRDADDVITWLCQELYKLEGVNRSCFIRPFFKLINFPSVTS